MRATVCLPTYNERENLAPMIAALGACLREDDRVLVIDDSSPDGTGEIADRLAAEHAFVDVLHREREGGARPRVHRRLPARARRRRRARARDGLRLLARPGRRAAADRGGERAPTSCSARATCAGGGVAQLGARAPGDLARRLALRRSCCSACACSDLTGGFKCFRRRVLEAIDLDAITPRGYAFQIETTYRVMRAGFRVVEIPITFGDRGPAVEDEPGDRPGGGLARAAPAARRR